MLTFFLVLLGIYIAYQIHAGLFFGSKEFRIAKRKVERLIRDCNELNKHIEELKHSQLQFTARDNGRASITDTSAYNYQRREWSNAIRGKHVHNCSAVICKNAKDQPFKYLCKYFDIKVDEKSLANFEDMLNDFSAAEQGKVLLQNQKESILASIASSVPPLIRIFSKARLAKALGFESIDLSNLYIPSYTFQYVSAGGNSSIRVDIKLDVSNLENFVRYLGDLVRFRKSIKGQRALMTTSLREKIKSRDGYTCKSCGANTAEEKNLLLEIDHIIPLSKGGITSEDNLQTLCWRCNRSKGAKLI